jgi:hypothetical protein
LVQAFGAALLSAIRERPADESIVQAFRRFALEPRGFLSSNIEPWVIANALLGVHRALLGYVRRQALATIIRSAGYARAVAECGTHFGLG